jgi:repressor LexA
MTTTDQPQTPATAKQAQVLEWIRANSRLYSPTVREIAAAFKFASPNGVVCHLKALERKGLIRRTPNSSRGIEVIA